MKSHVYNTGQFLRIFEVIFLIIISIASTIFYFQRHTITNEKSGELRALFKHKEQQLPDWKKERISDAFFIKNNQNIMNYLDNFQNNETFIDTRTI